MALTLDEIKELTVLALSETTTTGYKKKHTIPSYGEIETVPANSVTLMFSNTGGSFTGTPTINTVYYTDHEPI